MGIFDRFKKRVSDKRTDEKGDARAQYNLGIMCTNGDGVIMNRDRAAILFRRACVGGVAAACRRE